MDQNQTFDQNFDNDLQRAIDNITNTTNTDPVFSDPVAAPSSIPEGDTGELGEPVGPFPTPAPMPEAHVEMVAPAAEPIAPIDPISIPTLDIPEPTPFQVKPTETSAEMAGATTAPNLKITTPPTPGLTPDTSTDQPKTQTVQPEAPMAPPETPASEPAPLTTPENTNPDAKEVKTAALRDLAPLLDHVNLDPAQKFAIYRDIFEDLKDFSTLKNAYQSASEIADETERANALLYLVQSIDKM